MPHEIKPMLAKVMEEAFDDKDWIFEVKLDGYRAIAEIENGKALLYSRNLISFNQKYPSIVDSLKKIEHNVVLDGEVVVTDADGITNFQLLQQYELSSDINLSYFVFDLLFIDGFDIRHLPLVERKKYLKEILPKEGNIKYSDHIEEKGIDFFELTKQNQLEGIMAKKADSVYSSNSRSSNWLKIKLFKSQEAIICGFTDPRGSRKDFGALILGVYQKDKLVYIGHTGGGFNVAQLTKVKNQLVPLIKKESPFDVKIKTNEKVTWVEPKLVCEVSFAEWTGEGHLRQPIFTRMRIDKNPKEVIREDENKVGIKNKKMKKEKEPDVNAEKIAEPSKAENTKAKKDIEINSGGHKLKITNLNKIYWPEEGYTKGDVIDYYQQIAPYILPYLKDRPESLNRHPSGITGENFFQKDMGHTLPEWILSQKVFSESNKKDINYLICQDKETLMYLNNLGCIEINPWHSRIQNLDFPDYTMIDLDPGENTFDEVIEVALVVKEILDKAGADAYIKTSGATGMHIFIPLGAKYDFDQSKNFANIIVELVHEILPNLTSLERSTKERRKQIYLDYLQNRTGQTIASVYSLRPKAGATVSTPLEWKEIKKGLHPSQFDIKNIFKRLEKKGDLFKNVLGKGVDMEKCLKKLGA